MEVVFSIGRASAVFIRLKYKVWERLGQSINTKLKVYGAVVLPCLLYACETWTIYSRHSKQLDAFHIICLSGLLRVNWQDRFPDTDVLQHAGTESIRDILLRYQLWWAGHVC